MAKFNITEGSVVNIGNVKTGMYVTFIDEVNGKDPVEGYHEIESVDEDTINAELQLAAEEFESRLPMAAKAIELETGKDIKHTPLVK